MHIIVVYHSVVNNNMIIFLWYLKNFDDEHIHNIMALYCNLVQTLFTHENLMSTQKSTIIILTKKKNSHQIRILCTYCSYDYLINIDSKDLGLIHDQLLYLILWTLLSDTKKLIKRIDNVVSNPICAFFDRLLWLCYD